MRPEAAAGGQALAGLSLFFAYGLPDSQTGVNPFWSTFGYPGPGLPNEPAAKAVTPLVPDEEEMTLEADAVPRPAWPAPTASCTTPRESGSATPARSPRRVKPTR
jgi:hypothetical protein